MRPELIRCRAVSTNARMSSSSHRLHSKYLGLTIGLVPRYMYGILRLSTRRRSELSQFSDMLKFLSHQKIFYKTCMRAVKVAMNFQMILKRWTGPPVKRWTGPPWIGESGLGGMRTLIMRHAFVIVNVAIMHVARSQPHCMIQWV